MCDIILLLQHPHTLKYLYWFTCGLWVYRQKDPQPYYFLLGNSEEPIVICIIVKINFKTNINFPKLKEGHAKRVSSCYIGYFIWTLFRVNVLSGFFEA